METKNVKVENIFKEERLTEEELLKILNTYYKTNAKEGIKVDATFFKIYFGTRMSEEEADEIREKLTDFIYTWYKYNQDKLIGPAKRKLSVRKTLAEYIVKKTIPNPKVKSSKLVKQVYENIDKIIDRRLLEEIPLKEEVTTINHKDDEIKVPYKTVSSAFKEIMSYMITKEQDKDILNGFNKIFGGEDIIEDEQVEEEINSIDSIMDGIYTDVDSAIKEKEETEYNEMHRVIDIDSDVETQEEEVVEEEIKEEAESKIPLAEKIFFFHSTNHNELRAFLFLGDGGAFTDPEESIKALQKYINHNNITSEEELKMDGNIQFGKQEFYDILVEKKLVKFKEKTTSSLEVFEGINTLEGKVNLLDNSDRVEDEEEFADIDEMMNSIYSDVDEAIKEEEQKEIEKAKNTEETDGKTIVKINHPLTYNYYGGPLTK